MDIDGKYCTITILQALDYDDYDRKKSSESDWSTIIKRLMDNEYEKFKDPSQVNQSSIRNYLKFTPYIMKEER